MADLVVLARRAIDAIDSGLDYMHVTPEEYDELLRIRQSAVAPHLAGPWAEALAEASGGKHIPRGTTIRMVVRR